MGTKAKGIYANFASVYDYLMTDIPYDTWVNYLTKLFDYLGIKPYNILDLGCGTGNISIPLAAQGYRVTGVDLSADMLAMAEQKARERGVRIDFLCQDMRTLNIPDTFDVVTSMVDSFNYLVRDQDMRDTLRGVNGLLESGGVLIFDLNSDYKIKSVFGDNTYSLIEDKVCYIWQNDYDKESRTCELEVTFFVQKEAGIYERFTEVHRERGFTIDEVKGFLKQTGFILTAIFGELTLSEPTEREERIFIIAKKL